MNSVCIIGNLTKDVDLQYLESGMAKAQFTVAVNRVWRDKEGKKQESVDFIPIVVWSTQAENCNSYLHKGSKVGVEGRLDVHQYEDGEGNRKSFTSIQAHRVEFLTSRSDDQQPQQPQQQQQQYQPQQQQQQYQQQSLPSQQRPMGPSERPLNEEIPF